MQIPDKNQLIGYAAIIIIIVSLASLGLKLTGHAIVTDTAVVNVTIESSAAINFTTDFIDFGTGSVNTGEASATVNTEGVSTFNSGWVGGNNLTLENVGNVNVSLALNSSVTAATFIGGTSPGFQFRIVNNEAGSCVGGDASAYTEFGTVNDVVCTVFPFDDDSDELIIPIQLIIASDSNSDSATAFTATITATGTYV